MAPRKANQPTLTREQIVAAAIAVVDRDGLDGLSMRKLGDELGMSPMSLYYHVPDKSSLYDLILEAVMNDIDLCDLCADDPSKPAEERLVAGFYALRNALLAHPNAVQLTLSRSMRTPGQLRPVEALLGMLFDAGLSPTDAITATDVIGQYVFGATAAHANHVADTEYHDALRDSDFTAVTPEDFPNTSRVLAEGEYLGSDEEFDRGLRILVRGFLALSD
jgi:AcrR family transcriptional regulator